MATKPRNLWEWPRRRTTDRGGRGAASRWRMAFPRPFAPLFALPAAAQGDDATPFVFLTLAANGGPTGRFNRPGVATGLARIEVDAIQ